MAEEEKLLKKEITPSEYGVVFAVIVGFGVGLIFGNFFAGAFFGVPVGFIAGILYGNMVKNKK
ncbi:MAG: hypothetical protein WC437_00950 [Patescibacteria group bacterium]|jgi:hypothetical protein|nr:hypothetical protein [Patescibacteria group bacterium]